jgi:hypothetical protein
MARRLAVIHGGTSVSVRTREEDMLVRTEPQATPQPTRLSFVILRMTSHGAWSGA